jgi:hypothetical protein
MCDSDLPLQSLSAKVRARSAGFLENDLRSTLPSSYISGVVIPPTSEDAQEREEAAAAMVIENHLQEINTVDIDEIDDIEMIDENEKRENPSSLPTSSS